MEIQTATVEQYDEAFSKEAEVKYPVMDYEEQRLGFSIDADRLLNAARVLACPVKKNPPNWQHGRLIYALVRNILAGRITMGGLFVDVGTAKGFSALMMQYALDDIKAVGRVISFDVIDPTAKVRRNTIAEVAGYKTLDEILAPYPAASKIKFYQGSCALYNNDRVTFAFVDGKHTEVAVRNDCEQIMPWQTRGDVILFDDAQIDPVRRAIEVMATKHKYRVRYQPLKAGVVDRTYAIATKGL